MKQNLHPAIEAIKIELEGHNLSKMHDYFLFYNCQVESICGHFYDYFEMYDEGVEIGALFYSLIKKHDKIKNGEQLLISRMEVYHILANLQIKLNETN